MVSLLTWTLVILSSTIYLAFCDQDLDASIAADAEESGLDRKDFKEGAPISGFDFYSSEDNGHNWWDYEDLGLNDEDERLYSPRVQDAKLNTAVNLNLGYGSNLSNAGDIGSNTLYNMQDSIVNTGRFSTGRRFMGSQQAKPLRINSGVNIDLGSLSNADNSGQIGTNVLHNRDMANGILGRRKINTAVNLNFGSGSRFDNKGSVGSNFIRNIDSRMGNGNQNGLGTYSRQNYYPQVNPWKLNTAVNLKLGPTSTFGNTGDIGSNVISNRKSNFLHEPKYYDYGLSPRRFPALQPDKLYSDYGIKFDNQGYIGSNLVKHMRGGFKSNDIDDSFSRESNVQRRRMNTAVNLNFGPQSTFGNKGKIGSNIVYKTNQGTLQEQNINAVVNMDAKHGAKFGNEGDIGSNIFYKVSRRTSNMNKRSGVRFPQHRLRTTNAAANLNLGLSSTFGNKGKIGSNIIYKSKFPMTNTQKPYHAQILLRYSPVSEEINAATNLKTGYGSKFDNEGEIGSNVLYNVARRASNIIPRVQLHIPKPETRTLNSGVNLNLGPSSTFGNKGEIGSNIIRNRKLDTPRTQQNYHGMSVRYPHSLRSENMNAATNLNTANGANFLNEGEIGSNLLYGVARRTMSNKNSIHSGIYYPEHHIRTLNAASNLNLGPLSTFSNKGKIGSNIIPNRNFAISRTQSRYYPGLPLRYPQRLRSEKLNAAANINTAYGANFNNEAEIGTNVIYSAADRSTSNNNQLRLRTYFPQYRRMLNSAANLDLGPSSTFGNRGKIGSNVIQHRTIHPMKLVTPYNPDTFLGFDSHLGSQKIDAAANINTAYGTKFNNEGEIGTNVVYTAAKRSDSNKLRSGLYSPQSHRRTLNSAANLNVGPLSTFGNRGKIGSNIIQNRTINPLEFKKSYYTEPILRYLSHLRSQKLNAAANINTAYATKFNNEGEIGSNQLFNVAKRTATDNKFHSKTYAPQLSRRTTNSAANLNLGPVSSFANKGKIGSNIIRNRKFDIWRTKTPYYPEMPLKRAHNLRSQKLNAAGNINTAYGAKFNNEGEIGSNILYSATKTADDINKMQSGAHSQQYDWRTTNSAANLNLGPLSTFGNKGKLGSNVIQNRKLNSLIEQTSNYPEVHERVYTFSLKPEKINAAANLNTAQGAKFYNQGEIGSNLLYNADRSTINSMTETHSGTYMPHIQRRTLNSGANLNLGPSSAFGNKGKIGSNIIRNRKLDTSNTQTHYYPKVTLKDSSYLRSRKINAATNLNTAYGAKFYNEGEIGSNLLNNIARRTTNDIHKLHSGTHSPQHHWRTMNSATNLNLEPLSTFGNKGKIGSNIIRNRKLDMLKLRTPDYSEMHMGHPSHLRSEKMSAAVNLNTAREAKFYNEGEIGSNKVHNLAKREINNEYRVFMKRNPYLERKRAINLAPNLNFGSQTMFDNGGKIRSNNVLNKGKTWSRLQNMLSTRTRNKLAAMSSRIDFPKNERGTVNHSTNSNFGVQPAFGSNILRDSNPSRLNVKNDFAHSIHLRYSPQKMNPATLVRNRKQGISLRQQFEQSKPETIKSTANLKFASKSRFSNKGHVGSSIVHKRNGGFSKERINDRGTPRQFFQANVRNPNYVQQTDFLANNYGDYFGEMGPSGLDHQHQSDNEARGNVRILTHRSMFSGPKTDRLKSAVNIQLGSGSYMKNRGDIGANTIMHQSNRTQKNFDKTHRLQTAININLGSGSSVDNLGNVGSNTVFNRRRTTSRTSGVPIFENNKRAFTFVNPRRNNAPKLIQANSANIYKTKRYSGIRPKEVQSTANLELGRSTYVRNVGTIGSTLVMNDGIRRNRGAKSGRSFANPRSIPSSVGVYRKAQPSYDIWTKRTAAKKNSKGKGIVHIFLGSGSLFDNRGTIGNDRYKMQKYKPSVTSYAYVKLPSGKGRSFGEAVSGIKTNNSRQDPNFLDPKNQLINDGTIGAAEVLFSRSSVVGSNESSIELSNFSRAAVSFEKLGLDMTESSNKASIVAGDNSQIIINGKMGTYQVSIPIGSVVASEGSDVSMRHFGSFWSDHFSQSSALGLKSSLEHLKSLNSVITGLVKVTSTEAYGREKVDVCELENPITAVETGRPLLSNKLLLQLLFVTKLRINLANLLAYLTAICAGKFDERVYISLQLLYNAVQYRRINILPLLLLIDNFNTIPHKYHFRVMLDLLQNVSPSNVRDAIQNLNEDFEKRASKYVSENLIALLTDTLDLDLIPDIFGEMQHNVFYGGMDLFVNQVVEKAFWNIQNIKSVTELKDIIYLTILNLPLSYSIPWIPIKLRLIAQLLLMEITDELWICSAKKVQHISPTNVYIGLKKFLHVLLQCPTISATSRWVVRVSLQALPNAMPKNDTYELRITNSAPTASNIILGDSIIDNRVFDSPVEVTNPLGNIIIGRS